MATTMVTLSQIDLPEHVKAYFTANAEQQRKSALKGKKSVDTAPLVQKWTSIQEILALPNAQGRIALGEIEKAENSLLDSLKGRSAQAKIRSLKVRFDTSVESLVAATRGGSLPISEIIKLRGFRKAFVTLNATHDLIDEIKNNLEDANMEKKSPEAKVENALRRGKIPNMPSAKKAKVELANAQKKIKQESDLLNKEILKEISKKSQFINQLAYSSSKAVSAKAAKIILKNNEAIEKAYKNIEILKESLRESAPNYGRSHCDLKTSLALRGFILYQAEDIKYVHRWALSNGQKRRLDNRLKAALTCGNRFAKLAIPGEDDFNSDFLFFDDEEDEVVTLAPKKAKVVKERTLDEVLAEIGPYVAQNKTAPQAPQRDPELLKKLRERVSKRSKLSINILPTIAEEEDLTALLSKSGERPELEMSTKLDKKQTNTSKKQEEYLGLPENKLISKKIQRKINEKAGRILKGFPKISKNKIQCSDNCKICSSENFFTCVNNITSQKQVNSHYELLQKLKLKKPENLEGIYSAKKYNIEIVENNVDKKITYTVLGVTEIQCNNIYKIGKCYFEQPDQSEAGNSLNYFLTGQGKESNIQLNILNKMYLERKPKGVSYTMKKGLNADFMYPNLPNKTILAYNDQGELVCAPTCALPNFGKRVNSKAPTIFCTSKLDPITEEVYLFDKGYNRVRVHQEVLEVCEEKLDRNNKKHKRSINFDCITQKLSEQPYIAGTPVFNLNRKLCGILTYCLESDQRYYAIATNYDNKLEKYNKVGTAYFPKLSSFDFDIELPRNPDLNLIISDDEQSHWDDHITLTEEMPSDHPDLNDGWVYSYEQIEGGKVGVHVIKTATQDQYPDCVTMHSVFNPSEKRELKKTRICYTDCLSSQKFEEISLYVRIGSLIGPKFATDFGKTLYFSEFDGEYLHWQEAATFTANQYFVSGTPIYNSSGKLCSVITKSKYLNGRYMYVLTGFYGPRGRISTTKIIRKQLTTGVWYAGKNFNTKQSLLEYISSSNDTYDQQIIEVSNQCETRVYLSKDGYEISAFYMNSSAAQNNHISLLKLLLTPLASIYAINCNYDFNNNIMKNNCVYGKLENKIFTGRIWCECKCSNKWAHLEGSCPKERTPKRHVIACRFGGARRPENCWFNTEEEELAWTKNETQIALNLKAKQFCNVLANTTAKALLHDCPSDLPVFVELPEEFEYVRKRGEWSCQSKNGTTYSRHTTNFGLEKYPDIVTDLNLEFDFTIYVTLGKDKKQFLVNYTNLKATQQIANFESRVCYTFNSKNWYVSGTPIYDIDGNLISFVTQSYLENDGTRDYVISGNYAVQTQNNTKMCNTLHSTKGKETQKPPTQSKLQQTVKQLEKKKNQCKKEMKELEDQVKSLKIQINKAQPSRGRSSLSQNRGNTRQNKGNGSIGRGRIVGTNKTVVDQPRNETKPPTTNIKKIETPIQTITIEASTKPQLPKSSRGRGITSRGANSGVRGKRGGIMSALMFILMSLITLTQVCADDMSKLNDEVTHLENIGKIWRTSNLETNYLIQEAYERLNYILDKHRLKKGVRGINTSITETDEILSEYSTRLKIVSKNYDKVKNILKDTEDEISKSESKIKGITSRIMNVNNELKHDLEQQQNVRRLFNRSPISLIESLKHQSHRIYCLLIVVESLEELAGDTSPKGLAYGKNVKRQLYSDPPRDIYTQWYLGKREKTEQCDTDVSSGFTLDCVVEKACNYNSTEKYLGKVNASCPIAYSNAVIDGVNLAWEPSSIKIKEQQCSLSCLPGWALYYLLEFQPNNWNCLCPILKLLAKNLEVSFSNESEFLFDKSVFSDKIVILTKGHKITLSKIASEPKDTCYPNGLQNSQHTQYYKQGIFVCKLNSESNKNQTNLVFKVLHKISLNWILENSLVILLSVFIAKNYGITFSILFYILTTMGMQTLAVNCPAEGYVLELQKSNVISSYETEYLSNLNIKSGQCIKIGQDRIIQINSIKTLRAYNFVFVMPNTVTLKCLEWDYSCPNQPNLLCEDTKLECSKNKKKDQDINFEWCLTQKTSKNSKCWGSGAMPTKVEATISLPANLTDYVYLFEAQMEDISSRVQLTESITSLESSIVYDVNVGELLTTPSELKFSNLIMTQHQVYKYIVLYNNKYYCGHTMPPQTDSVGINFNKPWVPSKKTSFQPTLEWNGADYKISLEKRYVVGFIGTNFYECPSGYVINKIGQAVSADITINSAIVELYSKVKIGIDQVNMCNEISELKVTSQPGISQYYKTATLTLKGMVAETCYVYVDAKPCVLQGASLYSLSTRFEVPIEVLCGFSTCASVELRLREGKIKRVNIDGVVSRDLNYAVETLYLTATAKLAVSNTSWIGNIFENFGNPFGFLLSFINLFLFVKILLVVVTLYFVACALIAGNWLVAVIFISLGSYIMNLLPRASAFEEDEFLPLISINSRRIINYFVISLKVPAFYVLLERVEIVRKNLVSVYIFVLFFFISTTILEFLMYSVFILSLAVMLRLPNFFENILSQYQSPLRNIQYDVKQWSILSWYFTKIIPNAEVNTTVKPNELESEITSHVMSNQQIILCSDLKLTAEDIKKAIEAVVRSKIQNEFVVVCKRFEGQTSCCSVKIETREYDEIEGPKRLITVFMTKHQMAENFNTDMSKIIIGDVVCLTKNKKVENYTDILDMFRQQYQFDIQGFGSLIAKFNAIILEDGQTENIRICTMGLKRDSMNLTIALCSELCDTWKGMSGSYIKIGTLPAFIVQQHVAGDSTTLNIRENVLSLLPYGLTNNVVKYGTGPGAEVIPSFDDKNLPATLSLNVFDEYVIKKDTKLCLVYDEDKKEDISEWILDIFMLPIERIPILRMKTTNNKLLDSDTVYLIKDNVQDFRQRFEDKRSLILVITGEELPFRFNPSAGLVEYVGEPKNFTNYDLLWKYSVRQPLVFTQSSQEYTPKKTVLFTVPNIGDDDYEYKFGSTMFELSHPDYQEAFCDTYRLFLKEKDIKKEKQGSITFRLFDRNEAIDYWIIRDIQSNCSENSLKKEVLKFDTLTDLANILQLLMYDGNQVFFDFDSVDAPILAELIHYMARAKIGYGIRMIIWVRSSLWTDDDVMRAIQVFSVLKGKIDLPSNYTAWKALYGNMPGRTDKYTGTMITLDHVNEAKGTLPAERPKFMAEDTFFVSRVSSTVSSGRVFGIGTRLGTSNHVVKDGCVVYTDKKQYDLSETNTSIVYSTKNRVRDKQADVAYFNWNESDYKSLPVSGNLYCMIDTVEKVKLFVLCLKTDTKIHGVVGTYAVYKPVSVSFDTDEITSYEMNRFPGMSGAPIVDSDDNIVGVYGQLMNIQHSGKPQKVVLSTPATEVQQYKGYFRQCVRTLLSTPLPNGKVYYYLNAPTGTGKTTNFVITLLDEMEENESILVLEPTVDAANSAYCSYKSLSNHRGQSKNWKVLKDIGDNNRNSHEEYGTGKRIVHVMTAGKFLANITNNLKLFKYYIVDEAHMREDETLLTAQLYLGDEKLLLSPNQPKIVYITATDVGLGKKGLELGPDNKPSSTRYDIYEIKMMPNLTPVGSDFIILPLGSLTKGRGVKNNELWKSDYALPKSELSFGRTLIFVHSKRWCRELADCIHFQDKNLNVIAYFSGCGTSIANIPKDCIIVCTDVLGVSITIDEVNVVVDLRTEIKPQRSLTLSEEGGKLAYSYTSELAIRIPSKQISDQRKGRGGRTCASTYYYLDILGENTEMWPEDVKMTIGFRFLCSQPVKEKMVIRSNMDTMLFREMVDYIEDTIFKLFPDENFNGLSKEKLNICSEVQGDGLALYLQPVISETWLKRQKGVSKEDMLSWQKPTQPDQKKWIESYLKTFGTTETEIKSKIIIGDEDATADERWLEKMNDLQRSARSDQNLEVDAQLARVMKTRVFQDDPVDIDDLKKRKQRVEQLFKEVINRRKEQKQREEDEEGFSESQYDSAMSVAIPVLGSIAAVIGISAGVTYGVDKYGVKYMLDVVAIPRANISMSAANYNEISPTWVNSVGTVQLLMEKIKIMLKRVLKTIKKIWSKSDSTTERDSATVLAQINTWCLKNIAVLWNPAAASGVALGALAGFTIDRFNYLFGPVFGGAIYLVCIGTLTVVGGVAAGTISFAVSLLTYTLNGIPKYDPSRAVHPYEKMKGTSGLVMGLSGLLGIGGAIMLREHLAATASMVAVNTGLNWTTAQGMTTNFNTVALPRTSILATMKHIYLLVNKGLTGKLDASTTIAALVETLRSMCDQNWTGIAFITAGVICLAAVKVLINWWLEEKVKTAGNLKQGEAYTKLTQNLDIIPAYFDTFVTLLGIAGEPTSIASIVIDFVVKSFTQEETNMKDLYESFTSMAGVNFFTAILSIFAGKVIDYCRAMSNATRNEDSATLITTLIGIVAGLPATVKIYWDSFISWLSNIESNQDAMFDSDVTIFSKKEEESVFPKMDKTILKVAETIYYDLKETVAKGPSMMEVILLNSWLEAGKEAIPDEEELNRLFTVAANKQLLKAWRYDGPNFRKLLEKVILSTPRNAAMNGELPRVKVDYGNGEEEYGAAVFCFLILYQRTIEPKFKTKVKNALKSTGQSIIRFLRWIKTKIIRFLYMIGRIIKKGADVVVTATKSLSYVVGSGLISGIKDGIFGKKKPTPTLISTFEAPTILTAEEIFDSKINKNLVDRIVYERCFSEPSPANEVIGLINGRRREELEGRSQPLSTSTKEFKDSVKSFGLIELPWPMAVFNLNPVNAADLFGRLFKTQKIGEDLLIFIPTQKEPATVSKVDTKTSVEFNITHRLFKIVVNISEIDERNCLLQCCVFGPFSYEIGQLIASITREVADIFEQRPLEVIELTPDNVANNVFPTPKFTGEGFFEEFQRYLSMNVVYAAKGVKQFWNRLSSATTGVDFTKLTQITKQKELVLKPFITYLEVLLLLIEKDNDLKRPIQYRYSELMEECRLTPGAPLSEIYERTVKRRAKPESSLDSWIPISDDVVSNLRLNYDSVVKDDPCGLHPTTDKMSIGLKKPFLQGIAKAIFYKELLAPLSFEGSMDIKDHVRKMLVWSEITGISVLVEGNEAYFASPYVGSCGCVVVYYARFLSYYMRTCEHHEPIPEAEVTGARIRYQFSLACLALLEKLVVVKGLLSQSISETQEKTQEDLRQFCCEFEENAEIEKEEKIMNEAIAKKQEQEERDRLENQKRYIEELKFEASDFVLTSDFIWKAKNLPQKYSEPVELFMMCKLKEGDMLPSRLIVLKDIVEQHYKAKEEEDVDLGQVNWDSDKFSFLVEFKKVFSSREKTANSTSFFNPTTPKISYYNNQKLASRDKILASTVSTCDNQKLASKEKFSISGKLHTPNSSNMPNKNTSRLSNTHVGVQDAEGQLCSSGNNSLTSNNNETIETNTPEIWYDSEESFDDVGAKSGIIKNLFDGFVRMFTVPIYKPELKIKARNIFRNVQDQISILIGQDQIEMCDINDYENDKWLDSFSSTYERYLKGFDSPVINPSTFDWWHESLNNRQDILELDNVVESFRELHQRATAARKRLQKLPPNIRENIIYKDRIMPPKLQDQDNVTGIVYVSGAAIKLQQIHEAIPDLMNHVFTVWDPACGAGGFEQYLSYLGTMDSQPKREVYFSTIKALNHDQPNMSLMSSKDSQTELVKVIHCGDGDFRLPQTVKTYRETAKNPDMILFDCYEGDNDPATASAWPFKTRSQKIPCWREPTAYNKFAAVYNAGLDQPTVIQQYVGDIFSFDRSKYIIHCVSRDFRMTSGIAAEMPRILDTDDVYRDVDCSERVNPTTLKVGDYCCTKRGKDVIINVITKEVYNDKPSYKDLYEALFNTAKRLKKHDITEVWCPAVGCGADQRRWEVVSRMLGTIQAKFNIKIQVVDKKELIDRDPSINGVSNLVGMMKFVDCLNQGGKAIFRISGVHKSTRIYLANLLKHFKKVKALRLPTAHLNTPEWYVIASGFDKNFLRDEISIYDQIVKPVYLGLSQVVSECEKISKNPYQYLNRYSKRFDWFKSEQTGITLTRINQEDKNYPPDTVLSIPSQNIDIRWTNKWKVRLPLIEQYAQRNVHPGMKFSKTTLKWKALYGLGSFNKGVNKYQGERYIVNGLIAEGLDKVFGVNKATSCYGPTQSTEESTKTSYETRLDRNPGYPDKRYTLELFQAMEHLKTQYAKDNQNSFLLLTEEEARSMVNNKGAVGKFDRDGTLARWIDSHPDWYDMALRERIYKWANNEPTNAYMTIRNKLETKLRKDVETDGRLKYSTGNVSEEELETNANMVPRQITFADALTRLAHIILLGRLVHEHGENKLYKGSITGIPPQYQGRVLQKLWQMYEGAETTGYDVFTDTLLDTNLSRTELKESALAGVLDFSKFDFTQTIVDRAAECHWFSTFYKEDWVKSAIMNMGQELAYSILVNDHGDIIGRTGMRGSGELMTSVGNTLQANAHIAVAISRALETPISELLKTVGHLYYYIGGGFGSEKVDPEYIRLESGRQREIMVQDDSGSKKWKKIELTKITTVCDGDDSIILGPKSAVSLIINRIDKYLEYGCKVVRSGDKQGVEKVDKFEDLSFCSHKYIPVIISKESLVKNYLRLDYPAKKQILPGQKLYFLQTRDDALVLGKLLGTMKACTKRFEVGNNEATQITRGKLLSYLILYPHQRAIRSFCLAGLALVGDGDFITQGSWKTQDLDKLANTISGAICSVYGVTNLDNISFGSYVLERKSLGVVAYNAHLIGRKSPIRLKDVDSLCFQWAMSSKFNITGLDTKVFGLSPHLAKVYSLLTVGSETFFPGEYWHVHVCRVCDSIFRHQHYLKSSKHSQRDGDCPNPLCPITSPLNRSQQIYLENKAVPQQFADHIWGFGKRHLKNVSILEYDRDLSQKEMSDFIEHL